MRIQGMVKEIVMHDVWVEVEDNSTSAEIDDIILGNVMKLSPNSNLELVTWTERDLYE